MTNQPKEKKIIGIIADTALGLLFVGTFMLMYLIIGEPLFRGVTALVLTLLLFIYLAKDLIND